MQLLPGDNIFIATDVDISLYDTSSIEATANVPLAPTWLYRLRPTWHLESKLSILPEDPGLSQMYCCTNTNEFRLILSTMDGVYSVIIPCQIDQVNSMPDL